MTLARICALTLAVSLGSLTLIGCDDADGPAEKAGEKVDNAVDDAGHALERAGDKIQRQAE
jgi:hypothetical protein